MGKKYERPTITSRHLDKAEMQELLAHAKSNGRLLNLGRGMAELYLWEKGIDPRPRPPRWAGGDAA